MEGLGGVGGAEDAMVLVTVLGLWEGEQLGYVQGVGLSTGIVSGCMWVSMDTCVCMCVMACVDVHMCKHMQACTLVRTHMCICARTRVCACVYGCVCVCVCVGHL